MNLVANDLRLEGRQSLAALIFEVAGVRYGIATGVVREILRAAATVPLPGSPAVVLGVLLLRGAVLPVIDLRRRFGAAPLPLHPDEHIMVVEAGRHVVGLRVDRALETANIDTTQLEPLAGVVAQTQFVAGLAKLPNGLVVIVDPVSFLDEAESAMLTRALNASTAEAAAVDPVHVP